jgi:3-deoxy-D-manno-octulosonic-acid transferase
MLATDRAQAPLVPSPAPLLGDPNPGALRALLHLFYDAVWTAALLLAAPVCAVRSLIDARFRRVVAERLTLGLPRLEPGKARILVHGVSVGEVKGAASLVRALEAAHPELEVVISASTDTGMEVARQTFAGRRVVRFPLDPGWLVGRFLSRLAPSLVVLMELEVWPSFLRLCNRRGVPLAVVNGRITDSSFGRYHLFRRALPQFNRISLYCVQLEEYAERFRQLGGAPERVVVTGNLKADGFAATTGERARQRLQELTRLLGLRTGTLMLVGGSTHAPEERLLAEAWRAAVPTARLVLVPRHPPRVDDVERDLAALGLDAQRLTRLRAGEAVDPSRPLIVDTIGELEAIYALSDLVFVGGSLTAHGGQNVLEPAALGRAVLHGPHVQNFRQEVALLRSAGAARQVTDGAELARALSELAGDGELRRRMGEAGRSAVAAQAGATARTLALLEERCLSQMLGSGPRASLASPVGQSPGSE